jgi:hypothetical protein
MTTEETAKLFAYVRGIRNPAKKAYAQAYAAYRIEGRCQLPEKPADLSVMGAQAVRHRVADLIGWPDVARVAP